MNTYELMLMYRPNLKEDEAKQQITQVKEKIKSFSGEVLSEDYWGVKKLSYEIEKFKEAYYTVIIYKVSPAKSNDVAAYLNNEDDVLRHMVTCVNSDDGEN